MLTSVGQTPLNQMGSTQTLYPSVSLQQNYIPPVQLPSAPQFMSGQSTPQLSPVQFYPTTPQLTPRTVQQQSNLMPGQSTPQLTPRTVQQQPNLMTSLQEEGHRLQPQVNNVVDRVGHEAQGFFRWFFAPIRR